VGHIYTSLNKVQFQHSNRSTEIVLGLKSTYQFNSKHDVANILLTVLTNITVTTLIIFHVLRSRCALSNIIPSEDVRLYTGVVAILIESALPPSILGIITAALLMTWNALIVPPSEGFQICYYLFSGLFFIFCVSSSLHLQVIFLQRSLVDSPPSDTLTAHDHIPSHNRPLRYEIPLP
jgi:hypothetical protein